MKPPSDRDASSSAPTGSGISRRRWAAPSSWARTWTRSTTIGRPANSTIPALPPAGISSSIRPGRVSADYSALLWPHLNSSGAAKPAAVVSFRLSEAVKERLGRDLLIRAGCDAGDGREGFDEQAVGVFINQRYHRAAID